MLLAALALLGSGAIARAALVQRGSLRVSFHGRLTPQALPRASQVPIEVSVAARISSTSPKVPQLSRMTIAINRYGHLDTRGLPVCRMDEIQPATNLDALSACRPSLVGEGSFSAKVRFEGQSLFPSHARLYAFNGKLRGRPAILAHVYGDLPGRTSYTFPFVVSRSRGTFGTVLRVALPRLTSNGGYITGISMSLGKRYSYRGTARSYLSASCPAPKGFSGATFPFAKASFGFAGGKTLTTTQTRSCSAQG